MHSLLSLLFIALGVLLLNADTQLAPTPAAQANAVPQVFSSPINAGCIRMDASTCQLHVDPFVIQTSPGQRLLAFQLLANGSLLYDFRTDVSNPPASPYIPSPARLGFAVTCGQTYTLNLLARDTGDPNFLNAGQVENIACPAGQYSFFLPAVSR